MWSRRLWRRSGRIGRGRRRCRRLGRIRRSGFGGFLWAGVLLDLGWIGGVVHGGWGLTSGIGIERTVAGPTASMRKSRLALIAIVK